MDSDLLRHRLTAIFEQTRSAGELDAFGYWVGDVAGERQTKDNIASGRLSWKAAHDNASRGLAALDADESDLADQYAWTAMQFLLAAFEARMRPSDWKALGQPSKRRGRPPKKN